MFTGITRGTYEVIDTQRRESILAYTLQLPEHLTQGLTLGASVAIDGVCQTVVQIDGRLITFEAIAETLQRTTLNQLRPGSLVSVERSVKVGDEIGGHDVSGHVLGTGDLVQVVKGDGICDLCVQVPETFMRYIFPKGFVAVDGSSLTVGETHPDGRFWLHLIPETLRLTNLGRKKVGDHVNIEPDSRTMAVVETVERVLAQRESAAGGGGSR